MLVKKLLEDFFRKFVSTTQAVCCIDEAEEQKQVAVTLFQVYLEQKEGTYYDDQVSC